MTKKSSAKKKVSIFLQAKGGVGKSFISYFKMLDSDPEKVAVVLLDSSQKANQNKDRHIKVLGDGKVFSTNIYNSSSEYKKNHFFDVFEKIAGLSQENVILDVGAPESNVFREALATDEDFSGEGLAMIADDLGLDMVFNVLISGADDNVNENMDYFTVLNQYLSGHLKVNMVINDVTFKSDGDSDRLAQAIVADGLCSPDQVVVVGKSGNRNNDNAYLTIMAVANGDSSLADAQQKVGTRIRLRRMLEPLKAL
jgi:hypothetical protein